MSITATSTYMSNDQIIAWMEEKTDGMYSNLRNAMDDSNKRADAEAALNKISGDIANSKTNGGDASAIHDEVNATLAEYGAIPGVADVLQPIADSLNSQYGTANPVDVPPPPPPPPPANPDPNGTFTLPTYTSLTSTASSSTPALAQPAAPVSVKISSDQAETWAKNISDTVDNLGKKDQLALINIQEFNSEINQAKQLASALLDSADKSASAIISHIA
jgi:hypothetical protein